MERTYDRDELAELEYKRVELHNEFLDALDQTGTHYTRSESETIALRLSK